MFSIYSISSPETTLVKFLVWFWSYITWFFCVTMEITSLNSWVVSIADCRWEGCMTPRCLLVHYSVGPLIIYNGLWLSGLICLLLLQNYLPMLYGCRFESCQWLCSVYTNKKLSHPSSLSCVLSVAPTMVRSAVQPKTTRLCSSIRVISLWVYTIVSSWQEFLSFFFFSNFLFRFTY